MTESQIINNNVQKSERKKLYLLTGFLGAGKTSLLHYLLEALKEKRIGIIQNEFGKLGIDGAILNRPGLLMKEINRGSIFCSCLQLSFVQALVEMSGMELDYVFVESSGLADPSNMEEILDGVRLLAGDHYDFAGVLCLIDAIHFLEQRSDLETVRRQLAHCHLAVVSKGDCVEEPHLRAVYQAIRDINPRAGILRATHGQIDLAFLNEDLRRFDWLESEESLNREDNRPKTISLSFTEAVEEAKFLSFLETAAAACYRIKGFAQLDSGWQRIDAVGTVIDRRPAPARSGSELVFLSRIGPEVIRVVHDAWQKEVGREMKLRN